MFPCPPRAAVHLCRQSNDNSHPIVASTCTRCFHMKALLAGRSDTATVCRRCPHRRKSGEIILPSCWTLVTSAECATYRELALPCDPSCSVDEAPPPGQIIGELSHNIAYSLLYRCLGFLWLAEPIDEKKRHLFLGVPSVYGRTTQWPAVTIASGEGMVFAGRDAKIHQKRAALDWD